MLRIRCTVNGETLFTVSGRMNSANLPELKNLIDVEATGRRMALDLKELILVDRDAVRFLKLCESNGIELRNCSAYIREWITRERQTIKSPERSDVSNGVKLVNGKDYESTNFRQ